MIVFLMYMLIFVLGTVIGSFLNVVIYRVPKNISVARGRSYCPKCKTGIKSYDLLPVLSYLFIRGRCRACGAEISPRYPIIELLTGALAVFALHFFGFNIDAAFIFLLGCVLICITMVDFDTLTIPDQLIVSLIPLAAAAAFLYPEVGIVSRIIGFFAVSLPMYLSLYLIEDGFGGADIKLFAVLGFMAGWQNTLLMLFISIVTGAVYGLGVKFFKSSGSRHIPFAPFICLGAFAAILFGNNIIGWYISLF